MGVCNIENGPWLDAIYMYNYRVLWEHIHVQTLSQLTAHFLFSPNLTSLIHASCPYYSYNIIINYVESEIIITVFMLTLYEFFS